MNSAVLFPSKETEHSHCLLRGEDDYEEEIRQGLEQKLDAMLNRQLYSSYKTAPTEEEREQARQEYLDRRGVPQSYRWTTPPWEL